MSVICLIRHAQASFGQANYDCLSDLGARQATILALHFKALNLEFDAIYAGCQVRHDQTLAAYLSRLSATKNGTPLIRKTEAFNEYDSENILRVLIPEMIAEDPAFKKEVDQMIADRRSFQLVYEKVMRNWINREKTPGTLETWKSYSKRVRTGLEAVMAAEGSGKTIAVFTSGGPIASCVQKSLNLADEDTLRLTWQIMNTSITRFKYSGSRLVLSGFNDVTHLELQNDAELITYR